MFSYYDKLKEKTDKYSIQYAKRPIYGSIRLEWWNLVGIARNIVNHFTPKKFYNDDIVHISFILPGGIGDVLLSILYISKFIKKLDCKYTLSIYVHQSIPSIKAIASNISELSNIYSFKDYKENQSDITIHIMQYPLIQEYNVKRIYKLSKYLYNYNNVISNFYKSYGAISSNVNQTYKQQQLCLIQNKTRITAMDVGSLVDLSQDDNLNIKAPEEGYNILKDLGLENRKFITIQRGVDAKRSSSESIRLWSIENYEKLVSELKQKYPDITVIQLGVSEKRCKIIKGTDINLVGKTSFANVMALLDKAVLHIDAECGMVHIRHFLNRKPSVVFFGPTSPKTKGYLENINIRSDVCNCEMCEWMIGDWQSRCIATNSPPCSMYGRHKRGRRDDCNRTESYSVAIFNHTSGSPFTCLIRGNGGIIGIAGGFSWVPALLPAASDRPCTVCHLHFCTGARQRISAVQVAQLLSESIPGRRCLIPSAIFALFSSPPLY